MAAQGCGSDPGDGHPSTHGWCSLRLRFDESELTLLRAAEQLYGRSLARHARPEALRDAMALARASSKLNQAGPGQSVVMGEHELSLLADAARHALGEVQWLGSQASRSLDAAGEARRTALAGVFPELDERGSWRLFGVTHSLEALVTRLRAALRATPGRVDR